MKVWIVEECFDYIDKYCDIEQENQKLKEEIQMLEQSWTPLNEEYENLKAEIEELKDKLGNEQQFTITQKGVIEQLQKLVNLSECAIDLVLCEDDRRQLKLEIDQLHKIHHTIYDRITYLKKEIRDNTPVNSKVGGIESDNEELSYLLKLIKGELAS